jgi:hypothetical protein
MNNVHILVRFIMILLAVLLFEGCSSGGGGGSSPSPSKDYTVGGTVTGLTGTGLVLLNNNSDPLAISSNGTFTFNAKYADRAGYQVTVGTQPSGPAQTCTPTSNTGTILAAHITTVSVLCSTNTVTIVPVKLTASDGTVQNQLGYSLSISSDGTTVVSGASGTYAYVYQWNGATWAETKLMASDNPGVANFGYSVSASADGSRLVSGAAGTAAYVYTRNSTSWAETKLKASDGLTGDLYGVSVAVSGDGNTVVVGARSRDYNRGAAYVYRSNGIGWTESILTAVDGASFDYFGESVSASSDGSVIVVGAPGNSSRGASYVFTWNGASWDQTKVTDLGGAVSDGFGNSVAISGNGTTVVVGAPGKNSGVGFGSGATFVYKWNGTSWVGTMLVTSDSAIGDNFGYSVSLSADGSTVVAGAPNKSPLYRGAAYTFHWNGSNWDQTRLSFSDGVSDDAFGWSVSVSSDGSIAAVGVPFAHPGVVYVYK